MARLFDADVAFISELTSDRTTLRLSNEWRRPGVPDRQPNTDALAMTALTWTARQFEQVPYVLIRSGLTTFRSMLRPNGSCTRPAGTGRSCSAASAVARISRESWESSGRTGCRRPPRNGSLADGAIGRGGLLRCAPAPRSVGLLARGQANVFELIARGAPLTETLEAVARLLEARSEGTTAAVLVLAEDGRTLALVAAPGLDPVRQRMLDGVVVVSASPAGQAVRDGEVVVVPDVLRDPRFPEARSAAERMDARSITASPIRSSRTARVLGVLQLQGAEPHATDQLDQSWLESCAVLAAVAIEHAEDEALLGFQATHDPLTGVSNRSAMLDRLELALARNKRSNRRLAVFFCDLDRFKAVNDLHGHDQGGTLLHRGRASHPSRSPTERHGGPVRW